MGSNPIFSGTLSLWQRRRGYNSVGRVFALHARSHRFESGYLHFGFSEPKGFFLRDFFQPRPSFSGCTQVTVWEKGPYGSVVERTHGKGEAPSSILGKGSPFLKSFLGFKGGSKKSFLLKTGWLTFSLVSKNRKRHILEGLREGGPYLSVCEKGA